VNNLIVYIVLLTAVLGISWIIQDQIHQGLGLAIGLAGVMATFLFTVNELTKDRR
jgi:hypothetical protein